jgi:hypothetical protein
VINERNPGVAHSVAIWEAARATTAAPVYFDPIKIGNRKFGDGGFGNNNPAEEMRTEVACMYGNNPKCFDLLLSIGTGEIPIHRIAGKGGKFKELFTYINAAKKLASDTSKAHEHLYNMKNSYDLPYYRFNVDVGMEKIKLDEWKGPQSRLPTLKKIQDATETYCRQPEVQERMREVAQILVSHRNARKDNPLWPLVSRGEQYRCTMTRCNMCQQILPMKEDLIEHLAYKHKVNEPAKIQSYLEDGLHMERGSRA